MKKTTKLLSLKKHVSTETPEFPLIHTCAYMTHKNIKGRTFFRVYASQGPPKNWALPRHLCNRLRESPCAPLVRHLIFVYMVMSSQKTLYDIFQPSTTKPSHTSSTRQKRKSVEGHQEISAPKKHVFSSKWLEQFAWLVYVSTENHMKYKTCLDAYIVRTSINYDAYGNS